MSIGKYKKLYYVPGLISLVLLPLLLVYIGADVVKRLDIRGIEINAYHPRNEDYFPLLKRNYREITLAGNSVSDKNSIEAAKILIKDLYVREDTLNGVRFILQDSVSYGTFVGLINFFKAENILYFAIDGENIWVSYRMPDKQVEQPYSFVCGTMYLMHIPNEPSLLDSITPYLPTTARLWPILASLLLLILVSIKSIKSRYIKIRTPSAQTVIP